MTRVEITNHGKVRMDSRRIGEEAVEMAVAYGREIYCKGAIYYYIGKKEIARWKALYPKIVNYSGIAVIMNPSSNAVITCFRTQELSALIH